MQGVVEFRSREQILQAMINVVVARSELTDLLPASVLTQILAAAAQADEALYLQIGQLLGMFSVRRATRQGLIYRAYDYNTEVGGATYAVGSGYFTRPVASATPVTLLAGTIVASANGVQFRTLVSATIPGAGVQSPSVGVIAVLAGAAGNLATGAVTTVVTAYSGAGTEGLAFFSDAPTIGGAEEEPTEQLRQRLFDIAASLNRTSPIAVPARARLISLTSGERVQTAKLVEDIGSPGEATLYIDNGSGTTEVLEQHGTWFVVPLGAEVLIASAAGGEARFQVSAPPIALDAVGAPRIDLYLNTGTKLTAGVQFHVIPGTGAIVLDGTVFPTGLAIGARLEAVYTAWAGLIRAVQWDLSGREDDATVYRGGFAGGGHYVVRSPEIYRPAIACRVTVAAGFDAATVRAAVRDALLAYCNSLPIGGDIVLAALYDVAMAVDGVADFLVTAPAPADPPPNIVVADNQLVRLQAPDITVV